MHREGEYVGRPQFERSRESRHYIADDVLDPALPRIFIDWGMANLPPVQDDMAGGGYQSGTHLDISDVDGFGDFHDMIHGHRVNAAEALGIEMDDDVRLELWISARAEGHYFHWHTDADYATKNPCGIQTRLATFCYYMHTEPRLWLGGEFEFADGTLLDPLNNRLTFFPPWQIHRVRHVHAVPWGIDEGERNWPDVPELDWQNARWNVAGWVHRLHGPVDYGRRLPGGAC